MSVTINASTSSGLVMTSDLSGVLQFQQNGVALPNGGVAPAFSAYANAGISLSNVTWTKIPLQVKYFDTNSNFDNVTNYRFTPTVAGYYQINGAVGNGASTNGIAAGAIYKNGSAIANSTITNGGLGTVNTVSMVLYLNGSTDYVELYGYQSSGGALSTTGNYATNFSGSLVRGA